jgi:hypothetical protein
MLPRALRRGLLARAPRSVASKRDLNQREYCEAQGFSLEAFGNWRAKFKAEPQPLPRKLLYRRGGLSHRLSHSLSHVTYGAPEPALTIPPARDGHRRSFNDVDKCRIVNEAGAPGASFSEVARRYGIAARLRKWRTIDPSLSKRKPRSRGSSSSFDGSNARSLDGARNGSMATSLLSDWKTSTPILPACTRAIPQHRRRMSVRRLHHAGRDFPTICCARMWRSILMSESVPAAAARFMSLARRSARCSTSCRPAAGSAMPAGRSTRLPRPSVQVLRFLVTPAAPLGGSFLAARH